MLWFIFRPIFDWLGKVTGSYDGKGPTQSYVCAVLMLVLSSAWIMEEIGISAIFGGEVDPNMKFIASLTSLSQASSSASSCQEDSPPRSPRRSRTWC